MKVLECIFAANRGLVHRSVHGGRIDSAGRFGHRPLVELMRIQLLLATALLATLPAKAMTVTAIPSAQVTDSVGINTHIDFGAYGYQDLATTGGSITFLRVKHLRDCANKASDTGASGSWQYIYNATGAKFDDYMIEGSPSAVSYDLSLVTGLASQGILEFLEGGNEEDDPYAIGQGNSIALAQQFQEQGIWPTGQSLGLPVLLESFGSGWTPLNNWHGDYDKVGDMSGYANYGNAHTYPLAAQKPMSTINRLNGDAKLATPSDAIITSEIGYGVQTFGENTRTDWLLDSIFDGIMLGDGKMYVYALYDDGSGQWGVMNADGTPRKSGQSIHNLMTLLADKGALHDSFTYTLTGNTPNDNVLVMEKTGGIFWVAFWNETDAPHSVTFSVPAAPFAMKLFDPELGITPVRSIPKGSSVTFTMLAHPLLLQIGR